MDSSKKVMKDKAGQLHLEGLHERAYEMIDLEIKSA